MHVNWCKFYLFNVKIPLYLEIWLALGSIASLLMVTPGYLARIFERICKSISPKEAGDTKQRMKTKLRQRKSPPPSHPQLGRLVSAIYVQMHHTGPSSCSLFSAGCDQRLSSRIWKKLKYPSQLSSFVLSKEKWHPQDQGETRHSHSWALFFWTWSHLEGEIVHNSHPASSDGSKHQQTWQDFLAVNRSIFSRHLSGYKVMWGREREYVFTLESETIFLSVCL